MELTPSTTCTSWRHRSQWVPSGLQGWSAASNLSPKSRRSNSRESTTPIRFTVARICFGTRRCTVYWHVEDPVAPVRERESATNTCRDYEELWLHEQFDCTWKFKLPKILWSGWLNHFTILGFYQKHGIFSNGLFVYYHQSFLLYNISTNPHFVFYLKTKKITFGRGSHEIE
jgi:hypothetical protein